MRRTRQLEERNIVPKMTEINLYSCCMLLLWSLESIIYDMMCSELSIEPCGIGQSLALHLRVQESILQLRTREMWVPQRH